MLPRINHEPLTEDTVSTGLDYLTTG